ncbi:6845_t:CDS:2, partial [Gigaspora margarita]
QCLLHIGPCIQFSPFEISKLTTIPINKPTPNITPHSIPKKPWIFPLSQVQGAGKRITSTVKSYLESYFLVGNMNKTDRMTAKNIVEQLRILAEEGEISFEDIPEVVKVANWITWYAASLKKHIAETAIEENGTTRNLNKRKR